jgi:hypothetical protein
VHHLLVDRLQQQMHQSVRVALAANSRSRDRATGHRQLLTARPCSACSNSACCAPCAGKGWAKTKRAPGVDGNDRLRSGRTNSSLAPEQPRRAFAHPGWQPLAAARVPPRQERPWPRWRIRAKAALTRRAGLAHLRF